MFNAITVTDRPEDDPKNRREDSTLLAKLTEKIFYFIKVVAHDYCYLGILRLTSPAYREHLYWLNLQTQHLAYCTGVDGPRPNCAYCTGAEEHIANGEYCRPWAESGWDR